jgi:hypothetical protein
VLTERNKVNVDVLFFLDKEQNKKRWKYMTEV